MTLREWLLFFHILFAIVWVGGSIFLLLQAERVRRQDDDAERVRLLHLIEFAGKFVFNIGGVLVFLFGLWLVIDSSVYGFDDWWVSLAMLVVIASALTGIFFYAPQTRQALAADPAARQAILQRIYTVALTESALLVLVLWTMVFKPGS